MANPDQPKGFRPMRALTGGPWTALLRRVEVADNSSNSTNNHGDIYVGDPITLSSGKATPAVSGGVIAGVVVGVGKAKATHGEVGPFDPTTLDVAIVAKHDETSGNYVWYVPSEFALFEVQTASDLDLTVGSEADINVANTSAAHGDRTTGISTVELTTNSNSDVMVVEDVSAPDNDTSLANARHVVRFRNTLNIAAQPTS